MDHHLLAERQFGSTATQYLTSAVHATGTDLDRLTDFALQSPVSSALDLGCGAGHVSFALARGGARRVAACDPAAQMLDVVAGEARARGHHGIETHPGHAEQLPFETASFDLVVSRFSAHHWLGAQRAMGEAARVLRPGGTLVVIDVLAPEDPLLDTVLQTVELLRDASHVRDYRESEWRRMFAAAQLAEPAVNRWRLPMEFDQWVARIGTSSDRIAALKVVFDELPSEARDYFSVNRERSFDIDAGWFQACRLT